MSHLSQSIGSYTTKRNFELLLGAAVLFETIHLIGLFGRRSEVDGTILAIVFTIGAPLVLLLMGLAVTRLGSLIAKWVLIVLVALTLLSAVGTGTAKWLENPALLVGALAGLCEFAAILMLFTSVGRTWTGGKLLDRMPRPCRDVEVPSFESRA